MLEVSELTTKYGAISGLRHANLSVGTGEVVGLVGPNGAGKTTLLGSISGLLKPTEGSVKFEGTEITKVAPDEILRLGLALVPEHRRIFTDMTVEENLRIGGMTRKSAERTALLDDMTELFPVLTDKWDIAAGFLSGGEAQQLAIARALMSKPRLVMMDEPSLGLAPILVDLVFDLIAKLKDRGTTVLVVEQNASRMLAASDRAYVLRSGEIVAEGTGQELLDREDLFDSFISSAPGDGTDSPVPEVAE